MASSKQWYQELYDDYAEGYDQEAFVQGTQQEVGFIEAELEFNKAMHILDVGCGTGRHAIELARRGYRVTGVDLSANLLEKARQKARAANVQVDFMEADATQLAFKREFDGALIICEGAFPLMETDEKNVAILQGVADALKPGGVFILTTLNALFPLSNRTLANASLERYHFDPITFRETAEVMLKDDKGRMKKIIVNQRFYAPCEINWLLKSLGFHAVELCGCELGHFSRSKLLDDTCFEMLVIARL